MHSHQDAGEGVGKGFDGSNQVVPHLSSGYPANAHRKHN